MKLFQSAGKFFSGTDPGRDPVAHVFQHLGLPLGAVFWFRGIIFFDIIDNDDTIFDFTFNTNG